MLARLIKDCGPHERICVPYDRRRQIPYHIKFFMIFLNGFLSLFARPLCISICYFGETGGKPQAGRYACLGD
jgi:hypothetical protein